MSEPLQAKAGIDSTDFKAGITAMNRELRVLESGFRASAASLGDWSTDATGLESRIKSLTGQMDIQKNKVAAVRAEYERVKAESGENSRAAQDLEIKLNKETETLGKMGVELNTTQDALQNLQTESDETGESVDELGTSTNDTGGKMEGFKTVIGGVGTAIKAALGIVLMMIAAVVAVGAAMGGLIFSTAGASAELVDLSAKTGINVERLQEMQYIGDQVGVSLDTMTSAQARLVRSMNEGRDGTGGQADAFKALGISVVDAEGNLRNTQDVFNETIDALNKIENPAERDALAMALFGKSAQELNPLIKAGSAELGLLADKAHEVGAVMSEEDVAAFEAFDDTLASLQAGLTGTLGTLASTFLPGFQAVFNQAGEYLQAFKEIVGSSDGDITKIAAGLTGLVTQIATDVANQAPAMLSAGLSIVESLLAAIITALPALLSAGTEVLKSLVDFIITALPALLNAGIEIILFLVDALVANLPMLIEAGLMAVIALSNGLAAALPELIPAIIDALIIIINTFLDNVPMLNTASFALISGLADGLVAALPTLIIAIPVLIGAIIMTLLQSIPQFFSAAFDLVVALKDGLVDANGILLAEIANIGVKMFEKLAENKSKFIEAGGNFIKGMIAGLLVSQSAVISCPRWGWAR